MARFSNCYLIPNLMPWTPNTLLYTITVQDKDAVIVVELDIKVKKYQVPALSCGLGYFNNKGIYILIYLINNLVKINRWK